MKASLIAMLRASRPEPPRPRTRRRLPVLMASALLGATVLSMPFIPFQAMAQEQPQTTEQGSTQKSGTQAPSTPRMPDIGETGVTQAQDQAETVILPGTRANPFDIPEFELPTGSAYAAYQRGFYLTAFALATSQAGQGDRSAQTLLGELYLKGQGIPRDAEQAADWFELAAEENDPEAQFSLGMLYATGNGVKKDLSHALELFEKAADNGQKNAQFNLGMLYLQGQIVGQDITRAMDLFTKSATQGLADAQYALANLYRSDLFPTPNYEQARYWMYQAARSGYADAQLEYGLMLFKGEGIEQDYEAATAWIEQAANQGHILAQNRLARILARGYGAPPEPVKAAQYYLLSKQGGKKDDWLEDFFTRLPASEQEQALRAVSHLTVW